MQVNAPSPSRIRRLHAVPFTRVNIEDRFWSPRIRANREQTIPCNERQLRETGRIDALKLAWKEGMPNKPHVFWDSDIAKWIEAASYSLASHPDPELEGRIDQVIDLLASVQREDGYLNSYFNGVEPDKRWTNLRDKHEMYCAGHLIEAAVAYHQATGKRKFLEVMARYADHIDATFGDEPGKKRGYCGHEEIELALVKLARETTGKRYLKLAEYLVNERGRAPHYYDQEARERGDDPAKYWAKSYSYLQAHKPVREQEEVVGHAVRAMYLYSAMADLAAELPDPSLLAACQRLWRHATTKLLYIHGGLGSTGAIEGFTFDYDLPNETAYAETCAAIGLVFWSSRMLQLTADASYADVMERALYNGVLSGVSLDGTRFFYENPLASTGRHHRQEWFGCACCPPNLARLLASLGGYIYSSGDNAIAVHLYVQGSARIELDGQEVALRQVTDYPWDGKVRFELQPAASSRFRLKMRKPGWCAEARVRLNGEAIDPPLELGYFAIERTWSPGDVVEVEMEMPILRMRATPRVRMDTWRVALQRGPLVYCIEQADNGAGLTALALPEDAPLEARFEPGLLGGVVAIRGEAIRQNGADWGEELYRPSAPPIVRQPFLAVPYYAWDNREGGEMLVWLHQR